MEKGKKLIKVLKYFFKWLFNINLVLGFGIIGFQVLNIIQPKKEIIASYLGEFVLKVSEASKIGDSEFYLNSITGNPSFALNHTIHNYLILAFSIFVVLVSLTYNHLIYKIFNSLFESTQQEVPFKEDISDYLGKISMLSFFVFVLGTVLSIVKVSLIEPITIGNQVIEPIFDSWVLNFLWFGIGFFLLKEIFNVGINLKKEQDLTI